MIGFETAVTFFVTAILLALTPGPDNIFVVTQAALRGKRAGVAVTVGLCCGVFGHTIAVALGLAAIFQTSVFAFTVLKYLGAAYLVYLAYGAWKAASQIESKRGKEEQAQTKPLKLTRLVGRGAVMSATNPKVSIFFLAFLPQFVDQNLGHVSAQILQLGGLFMGAAFIVFTIFAFLADGLGQKTVGTVQGQKVMNRLAALIFTGLAAKLLVSEQ